MALVLHVLWMFPIRNSLLINIDMERNPQCIYIFLDFVQRRVIPIVYQDCNIPEILKPIYHLKYDDSCEQFNFWKRLAASLGYKEPAKPKGSPRISARSKESPRPEKKLNSSNENKTGQSPRSEKKLNSSNGKKAGGGFFDKFKSRK